MKTNNHINLCVLLAIVTGAFCASCDDFLTITPTDSIVEEEFWEDKNDLNNVVTACYKSLINSDVMNKYTEWGELRSDNFEKTTGVTATNLQNIMNANLLSTNGVFSWTSFYNTINYCNKVLAHGPEIVQNDESFSQGDWLPIEAEMKTIRALCHYYLVRTFGEVPYVTQDYNNDSQYFPIAQSTQIQVLDSIIMDLEAVKDQAMKDYGNTYDNKGRITQKTVYTLLADVYLWRASYKAGNSKVTGVTTPSEDYQKCIDCCDWVMDQMLADFKKTLSESGQIISGLEDLTIKDLFIQNIISTNSTNLTLSQYLGTGAYNYIFGSKNSRESIFELQIDGYKNTNNLIPTYFFNLKDSKAGTLVCSYNLMADVETTPNTLSPSNVFTKTDYRRWETAIYEGANQTDYKLGKYTERKVEQSNGSSSSSGMKDNTATNLTLPQGYTRQSYPNTSNWIFYRLSDLYLMKAEAMSQLYDDEDNLRQAFMLVREIFKRSNPMAYENRPTSTDSLRFETFNTQNGLETLVMWERQREFYGEGKRWFDLVRYAQRHGGTKEMLTMLTRKYGDNKKSIEAKLASLESLFSPIYTNEIKNNSLLHQNPVWGTTESSSKTDEL